MINIMRLKVRKNGEGCVKYTHYIRKTIVSVKKFCTRRLT